MKRLSWKYLAGLVDGEGCIDLQITRIKGSDRVYVRPRVRIAMSTVSEDLLKICHNNFGGTLNYRKHSNPNWHESMDWSLCGYKQSSKFLRNIVNSLILKKEQARLCLWMETNLKGQQVPQEVVDVVREELKLMKRDPHRLSERAQERIKSLL